MCCGLVQATKNKVYELLPTAVGNHRGIKEAVFAGASSSKMHVLRTVIFIAAIAVDALLGTEASTEANPNPQPLEGESEARNKGILSLMTGRWPGTSPAPSKLALLASLIAVLVGVRYYALMSRSSIGKQYSPEKRSLAGSQQSPPLVS